MRKIGFNSVIIYLAVLPIIAFLSSCSDEYYLNAIPSNSTAIVAVEPESLLGGNNGGFPDWLGLDAADDCGIDLSAKMYIFETANGDVGLSAKVDDEDKLGEWLDNLSSKGHCKKVSRHKDLGFTVLKDSWVIGFSSSTVMAMGPALPSQQTEFRRQITKYLEQDEEQGIKGSQLYARLDSMNSAVAVVAMLSALPEKFAAPLTLCVPKNTDASQVMLQASLDIDDNGCCVIDGEVFSFDENINKSIRQSYNIFRPIQGKYAANVPAKSALSVFMNVDGQQFINLLHANKTFQSLLLGMNMAVDMDNIIKSINGDAAVVLNNVSDIGKGLRMCAQLGSRSFLDDVDYWKQSCPAGSRITDLGKDAYCFTNTDLTYCFGVSQDMQFYAGGTEEEAKGLLSAASEPLPQTVQNKIKGQRLVMLLNLDTLLGQQGAGGYVKSVLGDTNTVLLIMK